MFYALDLGADFFVALESEAYTFCFALPAYRLLVKLSSGRVDSIFLDARCSERFLKVC